MLKGIDVSEFQGVVNWQQIKDSGIQFAILRAGYGQNHIDKQFKRNIQECKRVGIPVGIYWFSYAFNEEMAKREAQYAVQAIKGYNLEYPICFDFEYDSVSYCKNNGINVTKDLATNLVLAFCNEVKRLGYFPCNYTNMDYANNMFNMDRLKDINLWYAYYNNNCNRICDMWQYSENGQVPGINGNSVDMDYAFVNYPDIINKKRRNDIVEYIVVYNDIADERAAGYLADFLNCPTIWGARNFDYSYVKNIIGVGGNKEDYTSHLTKLISGANRYDTMQKVLNYINQ